MDPINNKVINEEAPSGKTETTETEVIDEEEFFEETERAENDTIELTDEFQSREVVMKMISESYNKKMKKIVHIMQKKADISTKKAKIELLNKLSSYYNRKKNYRLILCNNTIENLKKDYSTRFNKLIEIYQNENLSNNKLRLELELYRKTIRHHSTTLNEIMTLLNKLFGKVPINTETEVNPPEEIIKLKKWLQNRTAQLNVISPEIIQINKVLQNTRIKKITYEEKLNTETTILNREIERQNLKIIELNNQINDMQVKQERQEVRYSENFTKMEKLLRITREERDMHKREAETLRKNFLLVPKNTCTENAVSQAEAVVPSVDINIIKEITNTPSGAATVNSEMSTSTSTKSSVGTPRNTPRRTCKSKFRK